MSTEVLDLAAGTITAVGLYTGHPELEALGALMAVVAGGIEMANQSETQLSADFVGAVNSTPELSLWHGVEHQISEFQTATQNLAETSDYSVSSESMADSSTILDSSIYFPGNQGEYIETMYHQQETPSDHGHQLFGFF